MNSLIPENVLNHRINCVIRHEICPNGQFHAPGAESIKNRALCYMQIYGFYGDEKIDEWVLALAEFSQGISADALGNLAVIRAHARQHFSLENKNIMIPVKFEW